MKYDCFCRRGLAATVCPSYCQRCPDSPPLNTPGSLPWPLLGVGWFVVVVTAWPLVLPGVGSWWWCGGRVPVRCAPLLPTCQRSPWVRCNGAPVLLPALPVAGLWWWCPGLVAVVWLSSARFFAGRGCGNFHRRGCSLDVGFWPLVRGRCGLVAVGALQRCARPTVSVARILQHLTRPVLFPARCWFVAGRCGGRGGRRVCAALKKVCAHFENHFFCFLFYF